ncbi:MAG: hypothetical protein AAF654_06860 [Myxococcota bacterium]
MSKPPWRDSVLAMGKILNARAFWIGGFSAGALGVVFAWYTTTGVPAFRLLVGVHYFFYLWIGVGYLSARWALKRQSPPS